MLPHFDLDHLSPGFLQLPTNCFLCIHSCFALLPLHGILYNRVGVTLNQSINHVIPTYNGYLFLFPRKLISSYSHSVSAFLPSNVSSMFSNSMSPNILLITSIL